MASLLSFLLALSWIGFLANSPRAQRRPPMNLALPFLRAGVRGRVRKFKVAVPEVPHEVHMASAESWYWGNSVLLGASIRPDTIWLLIPIALFWS